MASSQATDGLRVLVASDQALVAEAVCAALADRGHQARAVRWPGEARGEARVPARRRAPSPEPPAQVGLVLSDLDRWSRVNAAAFVVERIPVPWVVLTTAPPGPAWGAPLAAGARVVMPSTARLDRITDLLRSVVAGELSTPATERRELEAAWRETRERHEEILERLSRLTPREREVLRLMYAGSSVAQIAEMLNVAPATVRSQVKAVLRKLDVNNQLAAVAAFDDVLDTVGQRPARLPQPRRPPASERVVPAPDAPGQPGA